MNNVNAEFNEEFAPIEHPVEKYVVLIGGWNG